MDETTSQATQNREVADYRLTMVEHLLKANVPLARGSIGEIIYCVADSQLSPMGAQMDMDALVRLSAYNGIGDRTGIGMAYVLPSAR